MAKKKVRRLTLEEKRGLIEREENSALSVRQQCELLGLNRSTLYYEQVPWNDVDLQLMNLIDELFTWFRDVFTVLKRLCCHKSPQSDD